jgi:hypothetical protein
MLTGTDAGQKAVPYEGCTFFQRQRLDLIVLVIEKAEIDACRILRVDGKICSLAAPFCAERVGLSRQYRACHMCFS